ncbi:MAG: Organic hydroperoxide resistance protein, partial [uncultured Rubrobacteraceae bacterium]
AHCGTARGRGLEWRPGERFGYLRPREQRGVDGCQHQLRHPYREPKRQHLARGADRGGPRELLRDGARQRAPRGGQRPRGASDKRHLRARHGESQDHLRGTRRPWSRPRHRRRRLPAGRRAGRPGLPRHQRPARQRRDTGERHARL